MTSPACLAFDRDIFQLQLHGGIRLYFTHLSRALLLEHSLRFRLLHPSFASDVLPLEVELRNNMLMSGIRFGALLVSFASSILPCPFWQSRKIYHPTYYRNPLLHLSANPVVVTVHDLIHECCPEYFDTNYASSIQRYVRAKRRSIFAADAIIVVSHATKNDLLHIYPQIDPARIHVIYHGSDHVPLICPSSPIEPPPDGVPFHKFFLYVGSRRHYKGFNDLLNAFARLSLTTQEVGLVCVGAPFTADEAARIKSLSLARKVISFQADEAQLARLYQNALCLVYPSWREGFGLPILEAMRSRCPVACSDIPSSREIADGHAFFFKAAATTELFCIFEHILGWDPLLRAFHLDGAQNHASRFTWKNTALLTCNVYLGLVN